MGETKIIGHIVHNPLKDVTIILGQVCHNPWRYRNWHGQLSDNIIFSLLLIRLHHYYVLIFKALVNPKTQQKCEIAGKCSTVSCVDKNSLHLLSLLTTRIYYARNGLDYLADWQV